MPKPRPGSHAYDTQRARVRDLLDDRGIADKRADKRANEILQQERGHKGVRRGDRAFGPKSERERTHPRRQEEER